MLEDVRSQLNQTKAFNETELSRMESRMLNKIDETQRNTEKFVIFNIKRDFFTVKSKYCSVLPFKSSYDLGFSLIFILMKNTTRPSKLRSLLPL